MAKRELRPYFPLSLLLEMPRYETLIETQETVDATPCLAMAGRKFNRNFMVPPSEARCYSLVLACKCPVQKIQ